MEEVAGGAGAPPAPQHATPASQYSTPAHDSQYDATPQQEAEPEPETTPARIGVAMPGMGIGMAELTKKLQSRSQIDRGDRSPRGPASAGNMSAQSRSVTTMDRDRSPRQSQSFGGN